MPVDGGESVGRPTMSATVKSICASIVARNGARDFSAAIWDEHEPVPAGLAGAAAAEVERLEPADAIGWLERVERARLADSRGFCADIVPVVLTYDLAWVSCPFWQQMCARWRVEATARSRGDIYALHLYEPGEKVPTLMIWDLAPVDRDGLAALAEDVGLGTDDPRVLPLYLRKRICGEEIPEGDLASKVLTQTGVARGLMRARVGRLAYDGKHGHRTLAQDYARTARAEEARTYEEYAARRACNRGGLVFVAARSAGRDLGRVIGIDEVSAHHAAALSHFVPEHFRTASAQELEAAAAAVVETDVDQLLRRWVLPWPCAFAGCFRFRGLRLRPGSVWAAEEIGLVGHARFAESDRVLGIEAPSAEASERGIRAAGYADRHEGGVFAFGHLMAADVLDTWVTDLELWCMSRVYEWDGVEALRGEIATKRRRPDDLAVLTSLTFYAEKQAEKQRLADMPAGPERDRYAARYVNKVKARFNALGYGIHAQDDYRPGFVVGRDGSWAVDAPVTPETFSERRPKAPRSWYVYGSRIAGWARVALVVAAELIYAEHGAAAALVAGDTDSLKYATALPFEELLAPLAPLHSAVADGIARITERARRLFPAAFCEAPDLGHFTPDGEYAHFYAAWQKAYVGETADGAIDITLAGVPRGSDGSLLAWLRTMTAVHGFGIVPRVLCFGATLAAGLSHVEAATYDAGGFPIIRQVDYNLADCTSAEVISSIRWQRAHGRDVPVDASAYAGWQDGRPILVADGDRIWTA